MFFRNYDETDTKYKLPNQRLIKNYNCDYINTIKTKQKIPVSCVNYMMTSSSATIKKTKKYY